MAQIRKGFIASNAIDGTKLKLLNNDAIRAANADGTDAELMKLDASNVLQFLKMPQVSSDPSAANDLARKSYVDNKVDTAKGDVDAALASETAAREAADSGLQSAIDTEKGRIDAILTAATADADSFAEIVNLINSVDTTNDQAFASYVLSNDAALASETSSRQSADSTLQSNIDSEASARASAVSSEASARQSGDAALQATIDALDVNDLGSVNVTSAQDGDIWQYDLDSGKWVNVAPLSEASVTTTPGTSSSAFLSWDFESAGSTVASGSANNNYGNITGGVVIGGDVGPLGGSAATFDGTGYVISSVPRYSEAPLTISMWFKSSVTGVEQVLWTLQNQAAGIAGGYAPQMKLGSEGSLYLYDYSSPGISSIGYGLNDGNWHSVTLTVGPGGKKVYVDGTFAAEAVGATSVYSQENMYLMVGCGYGSNGYNGNYFTGSIDNVHYYLSELSSSDVAQEHAGTYSPGSGGGTSSAATGVIKTNSDGMLDDSFLAYDVNFGDHKLQGVATPTSGTDAANKDYVDGEVSSEASARQSADQTLQSNIDAEQSAREAGDASLQSQIDALDSGSSAGLAQEIADRMAADSALQDAIDQEVSDRQSAVSAEASARQSADATLQSNIDTEKARIDAILTAATADADSFAEIVNLINSVDTENDNAFASYVLSNDAALAQEVSDRQAAVSAEQAAREAADADLASDLADETSAREAAVSAEQSAREAADSAESAARSAADATLQSNIDSEVAARQAAVSAEEAARMAADADLASDLSDESSARSAADTVLQGNIDSEAAARSAADSAEQAAREAADSDLQDAIDAEQAAREAADTAETAAREAADSALDARVDALEGVQHRKEKFTLTSTDISNGYVDLGMECTTDSEMVFVGALYLHSGDHYTVSSVGGVTRLTWAGDMMVGGTSELVAGDVVYVRYTK